MKNSFSHQQVWHKSLTQTTGNIPILFFALITLKSGHMRPAWTLSSFHVAIDDRMLTHGWIPIRSKSIAATSCNLKPEQHSRHREKGLTFESLRNWLSNKHTQILFPPFILFLSVKRLGNLQSAFSKNWRTDGLGNNKSVDVAQVNKFTS